ncbi:MAG: sulfatase-like hydrolase/transferase, partial [Polyangiaceae bacterium]
MNSPSNEEASEPAGEAPSRRGDEFTALERLTYWLAVFLPGFGVLVLVDAATASRIASTATARWLLAVGLFAYSLPLFLALAFVAAVVATGFGATSRYLRSGASSSDYAIDSPGDRTAAFLPAGALFLLVIAEVARFAATAFNNQKLASLLVAVVAIFAVVLAHFIHSVSQIALVKVRRSLARHGWVAQVIVWALALMPALLVTAWQLFLNWEGFKILGLGLLGGPILSVAVATGLRLGWGAPRRLTGRMRAVVWLALPAATVASLSAAAFQEDLPIRAVQAGQWSGKAVKLARLLTDIDGDGASSLFGGGDCAPRDSSIHPLAQDVPGDGIDSNCLEGDAVATTDNLSPAWYDDAPGVGRSRNLVLITIETLRADHLSVLGYRRKTSPQLDALAEKSVVFERTYAASSATHITIPSLFTTLTPSRTKVRRKNKIFGADASMPWIPAILQEEGLRTGAFLVDYFQRNSF